jgi:hypothetical protein
MRWLLRMRHAVSVCLAAFGTLALLFIVWCLQCHVAAGKLRKRMCLLYCTIVACRHGVCL